MALEPAARAISDGSIARRRLFLDLGLVALPLALLYARTMSRDLGTIDSGELAAVCATLGIAHPTGYSLYTLVGRLFALISGPQTILALTALSAAFAVGTALLVVITARSLLARAELPSGEALPRWIGLGVGLDPVLWGQAVGNEVYTLHLAFAALLLSLGLRLLRPPTSERALVAAGYVAGLAAAHHLSIVFLAPALLFALACSITNASGRPRAPLGRALGLGALALVIGFSVTLYLPIRSALDPWLNWGAPHTWDRFWRHALAAQYRVWILESFDLFRSHLLAYAASLPARLSWPGLLLAPLGCWALSRRAGRELLFLAFVAMVCIAWASTYDIHDLEPYFLPADVALLMLAGAGAAFLAQRLPRGTWVLSGALAVGFVVPAILGYSSFDRSRDRFVRTHAELVLSELPERSVLLSRHWDALVSPWLYLRRVEGARPDLTVIDTELLRRTWYLPMLERWDAPLLQSVERERSAYLKDLALFEAGRPYDVNSIEANYRALIKSLALSAAPGRAAYYTLDMLADYSPEVQLSFFAPKLPVPEGLVFALRDDPTQSPVLAPPDPDRLFDAGYRPSDRIHRQVMDVWSRMLAQRAAFLRAYGRTGEAEEWEAAKARLDRRLTTIGR